MNQAIRQFCDWLSATPISLFIQNTVWVIPMTQVVHILTIAIVLASMARLDLRMIAGAPATISPLARKSFPVIWPSLLVLLATGTILTIGEPTRELMNNAFRAKLVMIIIVAAIGLFIQSASADDTFWTRRVGLAKILGAGSLLLWLAIACCGRWIAYFFQVN